VIDARAKSTIEKYAGGFKRFAKWTEKYREISCILLCPETYVGLYLQNCYIIHCSVKNLYMLRNIVLITANI
jgi:hypothetical protein